MSSSATTPKHRTVLPSSPAGETAQTLDRGLRILDLLALAPEGLTIGEVAIGLHIHRTIAYRLLNTLLAHRLIARRVDGRYQLGLGIVELSRNVQQRLQMIAVPVLQRLALELHATAHLTVGDQEFAVVLVSIEPPASAMHVTYRVGFRHPLDRGASGIAILAARPPAPDEREDVALARQRGYAMSHSEIQMGVSGIAAPVVRDGVSLDVSLGVIVVGAIDEAAVAPKIMAAARFVATSV